MAGISDIGNVWRSYGLAALADWVEAQVVAPDLLDQLGVVLALDPDPVRPGHARRCRRGVARAHPLRTASAPAAARS